MRAVLVIFTIANAPGHSHTPIYPSRPITIVVPLAAGTSMDVLVRLYAAKLSQRLGQRILVDNRTGASSMIGTNAVAKANADGYTLLVSSIGAMALNPIVYRHIAYDPENDFVPIALYAKSPFILISNPALPIRSVSELAAFAKSSLTPLTYSSVGNGSPQHLLMEFVSRRLGLQMTHVTYRNTTQAVTDIVGGHVSVGFAEAGASLPVITDGGVRAIAVSAANRLPLLPDVSSLAEVLNVPDFEMMGWHILFAPANTPDHIINRLHHEMRTLMAEPEMRQHALDIGLIPLETSSIERIRDFVRSERNKWGSLVRGLGLAGSQ